MLIRRLELGVHNSKSACLLCAEASQCISCQQFLANYVHSFLPIENLCVLVKPLRFIFLNLFQRQRETIDSRKVNILSLRELFSGISVRFRKDLSE